MPFVANPINFANLAAKAVPTNSDVLLIADAADSGILKQVDIGDLPFAASPGTNVVDVTTSTQQMVVNTTYWVKYAGGVCTLTLPTAVSSSLGDYVEIRGGEAASDPWVIAQNANQFIRDLTSVTTTTSGTLTADNEFNYIRLECSATSGGLSWTVVGQGGSFTGA